MNRITGVILGMSGPQKSMQRGFSVAPYRNSNWIN